MGSWKDIRIFGEERVRAMKIMMADDDSRAFPADTFPTGGRPLVHLE